MTGSLQRHLGVLNGQREVLLREVEDVENGGFRTVVLAVMNTLYRLHDGLSLVNDLLLPILTEDGQLALHKHTEIHHGVVVPA